MDYSRQKILIGQKGQEVLLGSTVTIVGVGGLGTIVAELLCRMGIGTLILIDGDIVENNNLSRQHLFIQNDVGKKKVEAAKSRLLEIRDDIKIITYNSFLEEKNTELLGGIVVDCVDNHATRRIIDRHATVWVHGAAIEDKGTVMVFDDIRYDDVYKGKTIDTHCELTGVLGTITTIVGALQTQKVIDILLGRQIEPVLLRIRADGNIVSGKVYKH